MMNNNISRAELYEKVLNKERYMHTQIRELIAKNERLIGRLDEVVKLLSIARCPNTLCIEGSIPHGPTPDDYWTFEQCQWCHERDAILANADDVQEDEQAIRVSFTTHTDPVTEEETYSVSRVSQDDKLQYRLQESGEVTCEPAPQDGEKAPYGGHGALVAENVFLTHRIAELMAEHDCWLALIARDGDARVSEATRQIRELAQAKNRLDEIEGLTDKWRTSARINSKLKNWKDWDDGWARAEFNCAYELQAIFDK